MTPNLERALWQLAIKQAIDLYQEKRAEIQEIWAKEATSARRLAELTQLVPAKTPLPMGLPSRPSVLTGSLVGGLAGAGLGYGIGSMVDYMTPEEWRKGNAKRYALVGAGLGVLPAAFVGLSNHMSGLPINDTSKWTHEATPQENEAFGQQNRLLNLKSLNLEPKPEAPPPPLPGQLQTGMDPDMKFAEDMFGSNYGIEPLGFTNMIWNDPRVANRLTFPEQAAAAGLIEAAAQIPVSQNSRVRDHWVTPADVGRIAAGMGAGYMSGALVGRGLGILMGMPQPTQERLKQTGAMAGFISAIIPKAFGQ